MPEIYLALGSNVGDRLQNLKQACQELQCEISSFKFSRIVETIPQYFAEQPLFLNQVIQGVTSLPPLRLLSIIKQIEKKIGRTKTFKNGPRVLDIDIISYGDLVMDDPQLIIPHPRLYERSFVFQPLFELNQNWVCPRTNQSLYTIFQNYISMNQNKNQKISQPISV